ncbi:UDP-glucose 4-epimerase GalE [Oecophyllibacter saccharovorans]|uniref:UDP-glucose 4-epimerase n=1 Tax=Oecophyllibacter saccharovorans TaxID=2558360 RepID=A0A506ULZ1_9PROT|nr:UDP-glucose 4-epimerase GalE [Oecophyllibacter saccharovorans]QDH15514.1 UDP-glucose 4-epimerase GalE [Oecophyllibacter saccharovorans]TPW34349.1 UDP-glucose 4-epimerase GalE [Oecophyllibacter saccharovorans]TPW36535.1 UDP-glucose 4-epimerase GalE [Oecophyllibacter saccharovorans]
MKCLVTGGAGFVGSHVALSLLDAGHEVTILDDLSTGYREAVPAQADFHQVDLGDAQATRNVVESQDWDAVLHFAALSLVGHSMQKPYYYLGRNTQTSLNLIEACATSGVKRFVFSSTAALFGGEDRTPPIADDAEIDPGSPYGESKFFIERALVWADRIHGMHHACLRYFNAAGADPQGRSGEAHQPETHLIPLAIDAVLGRRPGLKLFGNDYPTRDGTCVRDYIHVTDLADAHIRAIGQLGDRSVTYNLGNGRGFTNLEVIESVGRVAGRPVPWEWAPRREGDPSVLVADSSRIRRETGWTPRYAELDQIVETAFRWREAHPHGFSAPA